MPRDRRTALLNGIKTAAFTAGALFALMFFVGFFFTVDLRLDNWIAVIIVGGLTSGFLALVAAFCASIVAGFISAPAMLAIATVGYDALRQRGVRSVRNFCLMGVMSYLAIASAIVVTIAVSGSSPSLFAFVAHPVGLFVAWSGCRVFAQEAMAGDAANRGDVW